MRNLRLERSSDSRLVANMMKTPGWKVFEKYTLLAVSKILDEGVKNQRPETWAKYEGARMIARLPQRIADVESRSSKEDAPLEDE